MSDLTLEQIDALEALEKAATGGEWETWYAGVQTLTPREDGSTGVCLIAFDNIEDMLCIAALRNAAPALFAAARRGLEAEELIEDFADWHGEGPPTTPWQDIVRSIGQKARAFLAKKGEIDE